MSDSNEIKEIKTIQFKRGIQQVLQDRLTESDLGVLKAGEPAYATDTHILKIGDGHTDYINLPSICGAGGEDPRFVIQDPITNQVLLYDSTIQKWVNKDLADADSIIYLSSRGLTIKGYDSATHGQLLVKDTTEGLAWIDNPIPGKMQEIDEKVQIATNKAAEAGTYAVTAANEAQKASVSAETAELINQQTVDYVENKFWWGTADEYNALTEINEGTFYFIKP